MKDIIERVYRFERICSACFTVIPVEVHYPEMRAIVTCPNCWKKLCATVSGRQIQREEKKAFLFERKEWARELLKERGLTVPGDETEGIFLGVKYEVRIGPKKGVRIRKV